MECREEWVVPQLMSEYGAEVLIVGGYLDGRTAPAVGPVLICPLESSEEVYRLQGESGDLRFVYARTRSV